MKTWTLKIELKIADSWIADGFEIDKERLEVIEEKLSDLLPYAYGHEFKVKATVTKAPDKKAIRDLQSGEVEIKD